MATNQIQSAWQLKKPQHLVYIEFGPGNGGMMLGICEEGLSYRAVSPLISDGPVSFSLVLDGKNRLQGVGEIVWSEDGGKTGGLKFTNASPQFHESLRAWLASEAIPKNVGREITPAAAMPLDSLEKIKDTVREKSVPIPEPPQVQKPEEPKKQFKQRDWSKPISELMAPVQKQAETRAIEATPAEDPVEARKIEVKPVEVQRTEVMSPETTTVPMGAHEIPQTERPSIVQVSPPQTKALETKELTPTIVEAKPAVPNTAEAKLIEPMAIESAPSKETLGEKNNVEVKAVNEEIEPKYPQESAVERLLHHAEPKAPEHLQSNSGVALPKLRLPFLHLPVAEEPAKPEPIRAEPRESVASTSAHEAKPEASPVVSEELKVAIPEGPPTPVENLPTENEVATALAAPGLPGLHEPKEFVFAEHLPEEDSPFPSEPSRLNRAAAKAIIGLGLAIICVALVFSFRREVGQAMIQFGQILSGEETKQPSTIQKTPPAPMATAPDDSSYPPVAAPSKETAAQPQPEVSSTPTSGDTVKEVPDLPTSNGAENGQREFEQARNILKGNHRKRDLPDAVALLWSSVEKGYVSAEVTLADLYARGDGVEKSCEQARVLLEAAVRKGSPEARRRLNLLSQQGCS